MWIALASRSGYNKFPQTCWLKTAEVYHLTILEARNRKSRKVTLSSGIQGRIYSHVASCSARGPRPPTHASVFPLLSKPPLSPQRSVVLGLRAQPGT